MSTTPATTVRSDPADIAVAFSQILRGLGLRVPASSTHTYADALGAVGLDARDGVYWAGRATLVRRPEDIEPYDRAFAVFFEGRSGGADQDEPDPIHLTIAVDTDEDADDSDDDDSSSRDNDDETIELRFSAAEVLRHKDFAAYDDDELRSGADADVGPASGRIAARLAATRADAAGRRVIPTSARPCAPPCAPVANRRAAQFRDTVDPAASTGARPRRQRLDGALRTGAAAVRPRRRRRPTEGRGVRPRHPPDPRHPRAHQPRSRRRPAGCRRHA